MRRDTGDDNAPSASDDGDVDEAAPVSSPVECTPELAGNPDAWFLSYDPDWEGVDAYGEQGLLLAEREEGQVVAVPRDCTGRDRGAPFWTDPPEPGEADTFDDVIGARDRAFARLDLAEPTPQFAPPGRALVGTPAWLWIDDPWELRTESDQSPGGVTVTVSAEPRQLTWTTPEGEQTCDGPGIPWTEAAWDDYQRQSTSSRGAGNPACTTTFIHASTGEPDGTYATTVTVTWTLEWTLADGPAQDLGTLDMTTDLPIEVFEVRAVRTR